ncbi:ribbon-helix-helix protein, CopG family [Geoglobus acetivorans]
MTMVTVCLTFSMSPKYREKIRWGAEKLGISESELVRRAIDSYIASLGFFEKINSDAR